MIRVIAVVLLMVGLTVIGLSLYSGFKKAPPEPTPVPGPTPAPTPAPWTPVCVRANEKINEHYVPVRDSKAGQIVDWKIRYYAPPVEAGRNAMLVDGDTHEWSHSSQPLYKLVWQSDDDPLLARHPMNKKSQHQWVVAHLVHRVDCTNIPPPTPTPTETPTPTPKPTPDSVAPLWYIASLNAKVTELRFFEAEYDIPPRNKRVYAKRFRAAESRYICWEIVLTHSRVPYSIANELRAVYYGDQGEFARQEIRITTNEGWTNSYYQNGFGNKTAGEFWKPGNYRVDIWVENQKVASGTFDVY